MSEELRDRLSIVEKNIGKIFDKVDAVFGKLSSFHSDIELTKLSLEHIKEHLDKLPCGTEQQKIVLIETDLIRFKTIWATIIGGIATIGAVLSIILACMKFYNM